MKLLCNRFAIVPHLCSECRMYIWLEAYRRADVWNNLYGHFHKENICKDCLSKFDIGGTKNEHV